MRKTWLRYSPSLLVLVTGLAAVAPAQCRDKSLVLEGARLIDGTGRPPLEDSALVVEGGKVRAVGKRGSIRYPKGAEVMDVRGKTILPALINLHGHLGLTAGLKQGAENYTEANIREQLAKYLAYGVGTVVSLGSDQDLIYQLREAQRAAPPGRSLRSSRLFTAGRGFGVKGGYPPTLANAEDRYRAETAEEARTQVRELAQHHPDFVKIWVDDDFDRVPKMQPEIYRAIIDEAHRHGLRVLAHVFYLADAKALVAAGVDGLGHSVRDQVVDLELASAMKARGVFLVPTLVRDESTFIYAEGAKWLDDPFFQAGVDRSVLATLRSAAFIEKFRSNPDIAKLKSAFEMGKKNLKTLFEAGVKIGFGTDSGPPLRFQGYFEHRELQLMVESGLTPAQAIVAATGAGAQILAGGAGVNPPKADGSSTSSDFGTLEPGKQADFLVLDADPLEDIHATERLSAVWQAGEPVRAFAAQGETR